jgi:flagellar hook-length control protein FliK
MVEKAALNLKNGQSELRLNLKPDFLGQVRMRIITENNQVTLKILTEYVAVKDIIETNIHQLKADLQSQGLEINSLDVSVTKDSQQQGSGNHTTDLSKTEKETGAKSQRDSREQTELHQSTASGQEEISKNAIDYFA